VIVSVFVGVGGIGVKVYVGAFWVLSIDSWVKLATFCVLLTIDVFAKNLWTRGRKRMNEMIIIIPTTPTNITDCLLGYKSDIAILPKFLESNNEE